MLSRNTKRTVLLAAILTLAVTLSACGGGGGGSSTPPAASNQPPTANAGSSVAAAENSAVQLAGSGSDPDGGSVSFTWSQVSGPTGSFDDTAAADAVFSVPALSGGVETGIVLRLTVRDGEGATATDDMTITAGSTDIIVYRARRSALLPFVLYAFNPRTSVELQLSGIPVAGGNVFLGPLLSPDKTMVAYTADENELGRQELFVAAVDGSGVTQVSPTFANDQTRINRVQWSPDGSRIAYSIDATSVSFNEIFLVDPDGGNHTAISAPLAPAGNISYVEPNWSPDGRYIAFIVQDRSIGFVGIDMYDTQSAQTAQRVVDIAPLSIEQNRLTRTPVRWSAWAPDNSALAFTAQTDAAGTIELFSVTPDGSTITRLNGDVVSFGRVYDYAWSPDAAQIAYIAEQETLNVRDLYVAEADGTSNVRVSGPMVANGRVNSFNWAPDSSVLAYSADQVVNNEIELWIASRQGNSVIRASGELIDGGRVDRFEWSPDGSMIAYRARQDTLDFPEIYISAADGSNNRKINGPLTPDGDATIVGFGSTISSWSPDGTYLLYNAAEQFFERFQHIVANVETGERTVVSPPAAPGGFLRSEAVWAPDGQSVVYVSEQEVADVYELYLSNLDATRNIKLSGVMTTGSRINGFMPLDPSAD